MHRGSLLFLDDPWVTNFLNCFSGFKDLFNWQHFIDTLKDDVHIVEKLPPAYDGIEPFNKTLISWSKVTILLINSLILLRNTIGLWEWTQMLLLPSLRVCLAGRFNLFFVKIWICFCLNFFYVFGSFWCVGIKNNFFKIKKIIIFDAFPSEKHSQATATTLSSNCYHPLQLITIDLKSSLRFIITKPRSCHCWSSTK